MTLQLGKVRGLTCCSNEGGRFAVLALDHRQNLRRELRPADPDSVTFSDLMAFKSAVVRTLASSATATLLDPEIGAAKSILDRSLPGRTGLIVAIEATGYDGSASARESRVLDGWSVMKAKLMGASAAKLLVYYHPDAPNSSEQERLVADVHEACRVADLPLFLEPLTYSPITGGRLLGEDRQIAVIETARRLSAIGGDVLKSEFPYGPDVTDRDLWAAACDELEAASRIPWVLLSGGVDEPTFLAQVEVSCRAGACGVVVGRSIWADAAALAPGERDRFLAGEGRDRMQRVAAVVDKHARPWFADFDRSAHQEPPVDWFRDH